MPSGHVGHLSHLGHLGHLGVMIHNHAHQNLFPFIITCPHSLLLSPSLLLNWYVIKLPL
jgi:hypothetical protein